MIEEGILAAAKVYEANKGFKTWKNFPPINKFEPLIKNPSAGGPTVPIVRREWPKVCVLITKNSIFQVIVVKGGCSD